mgnify:CR=1 FL=1
MFIITFQFAVCDMSVDLRCRKRLMSQQFFHTVDAGSVVEHHRRIRVAERVGRTPPTGNRRQRPANHVVDQLVIDRRAFAVRKKASLPDADSFALRGRYSSINERSSPQKGTILSLLRFPCTFSSHRRVSMSASVKPTSSARRIPVSYSIATIRRLRTCSKSVWLKPLSRISSIFSRRQTRANALAA